MSKRSVKFENNSRIMMVNREKRLKTSSDPMLQFRRMTKSLGEALNQLIAVHGKLNYLIGMSYQFVITKPSDKALYDWMSGLTGGWFRDQFVRLVNEAKDHDATICYLNGEHAIDRDKWDFLCSEWVDAIRLFTEVPHDSSKIRELMLRSFNDPDLLGGLIEFKKDGAPAGERSLTREVREFANRVRDEHTDKREKPYKVPTYPELWHLMKNHPDLPDSVSSWMNGTNHEQLAKLMRKYTS